METFRFLMKKPLLVFLCFLLLFVVKAQEKKFQINFGADTGFSKTEINDQSIDASTSGIFLHLQYGISRYFSLESGLDYFITQGNYISAGDSYFIENQYLNIPLGLRTKIGLGRNGESITDQKFTILIGAGLYTNYLMRSELEHVDKQTNLGWNLGAYSKFALHIQANDAFSLGAGIKGLYDFSDIEKDGLSVKQNRNVVYLDFGIRL